MELARGCAEPADPVLPPDPADPVLNGEPVLAPAPELSVAAVGAGGVRGAIGASDGVRELEARTPPAGDALAAIIAVGAAGGLFSPRGDGVRECVREPDKRLPDEPAPPTVPAASFAVSGCKLLAEPVVPRPRGIPPPLLPGAPLLPPAVGGAVFLPEPPEALPCRLAVPGPLPLPPAVPVRAGGSGDES